MSRTLETAYIPIGHIHSDWTLNPCERDEAHILTLANHINRDGYNEDYPLIVFRIKGEAYLQLTCGFHRFEATQLENPDYPNLPLKEVYCEIREGTWQEMIRCMNEDNFKHSPAYNSAVGRAPSREALRKMRLRLMLFPDTFILSDRALGNRWRCDHKAIGSLRDTIIEQFATGEFPPVDVPESLFLEDADVDALTAIIESDLYRGLDGKMRKRTTAAKQPTDTDNEVEQAAPETANHREASKLLKKKKQALKVMWDKRIQATADYVGGGDTDLNQYLSLSDLEKGFAEYEAHDYCADAFRSAFQRTSETSFNIVVEKALESDVSIEVLREEARAMDTYAYDILQWQKQDWIQQLIEKAKAKSEKSAEQERPTPDEPSKTLSPIELPKKPNRKELKRQHLSAVVDVQSAFFSANLHEHESFSHHPHVDTGRKAQEFFKRIVKEKDLRLNIFSEDYYHKTGETYEAEHPDMYRGRDLTNAEIEAEIEVLKELVENIRFYAKGDDCHIGWLDKIFSTSEALIPDTTAEADTSEIERKIKPDDLYGLSLDDIFTHVAYRVDNIPIEDESAVMERMATLLGKASRGWTGTQLYLLMRYAMLVSSKEEN